MISYPCAFDGTETRVLDVGSGPPCVFIHGLGARADRWRRNLEPIAATGRRAIAFDLPGHGFADKGDGFPFNVPNLARWVLGLMDELRVGAAALVGTSLGGFIAGEMACRAPERVTALVLVGTIGMSPLGPEACANLSGRFATVTREGIERKLKTVIHDPALVTPAWIEEEWRINNSVGAGGAFAAIARYLAGPIDDHVVGPRLAALRPKKPIAIIWGTEDRAIPPAVGHRARTLLEPALYREIPETGHGPYFEAAPAFNALVSDFLEGRSIKGDRPAV
ncbi:MAG: alpha/beta fold hydrolase [Alphaproteobacteria bacterium]|nr:alpha/beta fold hydrolase [Alphaproteobacteria bacterium]